MNCPFCNTTIKNLAFLESEKFRVVYNIAPIFPGHSLVIPKRHIESALDLTENEISEMMFLARKATKLLLNVFKGEAFNWSIQDKEAAGQSVAHLHLHIVIRFEGDLPDPGDWHPKIQHNYKEILDSAERPKLNEIELAQIVDRLKKEANRLF